MQCQSPDGNFCKQEKKRSFTFHYTISIMTWIHQKTKDIEITIRISHYFSQNVTGISISNFSDNKYLSLVDDN